METHTEEAVGRWRQSDVATSPGAPRTAGSTRSQERPGTDPPSELQEGGSPADTLILDSGLLNCERIPAAVSGPAVVLSVAAPDPNTPAGPSFFPQPGPPKCPTMCPRAGAYGSKRRLKMPEDQSFWLRDRNDSGSFLNHQARAPGASWSLWGL